ALTVGLAGPCAGLLADATVFAVRQSGSVAARQPTVSSHRLRPALRYVFFIRSVFIQSVFIRSVFIQGAPFQARGSGPRSTARGCVHSGARRVGVYCRLCLGWIIIVQTPDSRVPISLSLS